MLCELRISNLFTEVANISFEKMEIPKRRDPSRSPRAGHFKKKYLPSTYVRIQDEAEKTKGNRFKTVRNQKASGTYLALHSEVSLDTNSTENVTIKSLIFYNTNIFSPTVYIHIHIFFDNLSVFHESDQNIFDKKIKN